MFFKQLNRSDLFKFKTPAAGAKFDMIKNI